MNTIASDYFCDVVSKVFDDYFSELGAVREASPSLNCVRYSTDEWFAEVLFLPSDGPNYSPRVEIGCRLEQFVDPRRNRLDIMHTAPSNSEEHGYNLRWRYSSREQLTSAMIDVRDRVLSAFALPFLGDLSRLQALLRDRHDFIEAEWTKEIDGHNDSIQRRKAEAAFRSKDYVKAIEYYNSIPEARQTVIDKSKLQFAKSKIL